jgi:hypothetical protein
LGTVILHFVVVVVSAHSDAGYPFAQAIEIACAVMGVRWMAAAATTAAAA